MDHVNDVTGFSSHAPIDASHLGSAVAGNLIERDVSQCQSFSLDKAMLDYYPEYCMLKKLQQLTQSFHCTGCN
jgi:hypothetical protein